MFTDVFVVQDIETLHGGDGEIETQDAMINYMNSFAEEDTSPMVSV